MTDQLERTRIEDKAPVKYVRGKVAGIQTILPVQAGRRVCEDCGNEYWAWREDFDRTCANCRWEKEVETPRVYVGRSL